MAPIYPDWRTRPTFVLPILATNGCFDMLSRNHAAMLNWCRMAYPHHTQIVLLNSDASVRSIKGEDRPIVPFADRAYVLASLAAVDAVIGFSESTPRLALAWLGPAVYVKGGDYAPDAPQAWSPTVRSPRFPGPSTTELLARLRSNP